MPRARLVIPLTVLGLLASASVAHAAAYSLFIVSGQSNAVGYQTSVSQLPVDTADSHIPFFYDAGSPPYDNGAHDSSSGSAWTTLGGQPGGSPLPGYPNFAEVTGGFGPEVSLARTLYHTGMASLAVFKFAYNGTSFAGGDWNKGNTLYNAMLSRFQTAKTALENGGQNTVDLKALIWVQGESDQLANWTQAQYEAAFRAFIANTRTDYGVPDLPVFAGLNPDFTTIVAAQQAVAATDPHVFYVDTTGADRPSLHFTSVGTLDVGARFANSYLLSVPEPTSLVLLACGVLGLLCYAWWRRR